MFVEVNFTNPDWIRFNELDCRAFISLISATVMAQKFKVRF